MLRLGVVKREALREGLAERGTERSIGDVCGDLKDVSDQSSRLEETDTSHILRFKIQWGDPW